jgi:hypothetical protein
MVPTRIHITIQEATLTAVHKGEVIVLPGIQHRHPNTDPILTGVRKAILFPHEAVWKDQIASLPVLPIEVLPRRAVPDHPTAADHLQVPSHPDHPPQDPQDPHQDRHLVRHQAAVGVPQGGDSLQQ